MQTGPLIARGAPWVPGALAFCTVLLACGPVEDTVVDRRGADLPPTHAPVLVSPAPVQGAVAEPWAALIGDYVAGPDTLIVRERDGELDAILGGRTYRLVGGPASYRLDGAGGMAGRALEFESSDGEPAGAVHLGDRAFQRLWTGGEAGATFRIRPVRPVGELRAAARRATPPAEEGAFRAPDLVDLSALDPTLRFDIRYATTNNFMGAAFYDEPRAYLQRPAAEALVRAHRRLREEGVGLLIFDAYRPWSVTWMFWHATPPEQRMFVASPTLGSRHNRGAAVDLTLYDLATGEALPMPSGYDEFSHRAFPNYPGGTTEARGNRDLLRRAMEAEGFRVYYAEWWHYDYRDWRSYPILNLPFHELTASG